MYLQNRRMGRSRSFYRRTGGGGQAIGRWPPRSGVRVWLCVKSARTVPPARSNMPSRPPPTFSDQARLADNLLRALAQEGQLQGRLELVLSGNGALGAEFYIEHVYTRVPADLALMKDRLSAAHVARGGRLQVSKSASYSWGDEEFRTRFEHVFALDPFHVLVTVNGVLSFEDVRSASRTPIWGSIDFFSTTSRRDLAYERGCQTRGAQLLKQATDAILAIHRRSFKPRASLPPLPDPQAVRRRSNSRLRNRTA